MSARSTRSVIDNGDHRTSGCTSFALPAAQAVHRVGSKSASCDVRTLCK